MLEGFGGLEGLGGLGSGLVGGWDAVRVSE